MKMNIKTIVGTCTLLAAVAGMSSPVFAQDGATDQPPVEHQHSKGHHHGHFGGGLYMICLGQNLPAGTALPTLTKGADEANKTALKAFFTSDAVKAAAAKCTQYPHPDPAQWAAKKAAWAAKKAAAADSSSSNE